ncbi:CS domain protein, putative [Plasmodium gallinaceum]|uniref:Nuclear migration protein nudC n=1 Tax=Plasmodium gallinaceum TaxID=5849 RepID=A0A1J1GYL0_PLAGA|nr:CS domain protein, putative [Plasmodium gallinaceum]CRG97652.1 CS domain protein, putative [Plasmodium gallinaceum]
MAYERHENMLMAIARDFSSIDDLIEMFLSFLENKTDYFHLMINEEDIKTLSKKYEGSMLKNILNNNHCGFKANNREDCLMKLFRKHQLNYIIRKQPYIIENEEIKKKYFPLCDELIKLNNIKINEKIKDKNENKQSKEDTKTTINVPYENHISTWNGGKTDKYYWNQSLNEINLEVPLNKEVKTNEINVEITNKNIKIYHSNELKLEGEFYEEVNKQECMWSIEDKKKIVVFLEKKRENWWPCVLNGDPEIDTKKIESKKNLTDFDEKTQGEIRKFLHEQKLKNEGIQSPEEIRKQHLLTNALNSKGSPFK